LKGIFFDGILEIKCKRCGVINTIGTVKLVDDATHYLMIINGNGVVVAASDNACRILGYTSDELIGKHFTEINPSMPKEISKKFIGSLSLLKEDNFFELDTTHQARDGKKIPVTVLIKLYKPTPQCGGYVSLSVTVRNAGVAGADKTSGKNSLKFLDYSCDYYFCMDKDWIAESMSPSVEKLFGFPPEAVIGKNYLDFLPEKIKEKTRRTFKYFSANSKPFRIVNVGGNDAHGKPCMSEQFFTPNFNDAGVFIGYRVLGWVIKRT